MNKKGNLYYLIRSLTKSEKRYFKIFCFSEKRDKNYLQLFEAYEQLKELDEVFIKRKFARIKQLHVTKNYLNNLILASLRSYHASISKDAELKDCLRNVEILFHKELLNQCHYELEKAEKLAKDYELLTGLVEVLNWKRRLQLTRYGLQQGSLTGLIHTEKQAIHQLASLNEYWSLMSEIFKYVNDKEGVFLQQKGIQIPPKEMSLPTKILYHHLLYSYHTINENGVEGKRYLVELIEYLEQYPEQIKNDPNPYVTAINNLIGYYLHQKNYKAVFPLIKKVKEVPKKYQLRMGTKFNMKLQLRTYNVELEIHRDLKERESGLALIKEINAFLKKHDKAIPDDYYLLLWYQFASIYFMSNDLDNALKWVNAIINRRFKVDRKDLENYTRILNLMIHFELGNTFLLKYMVENSRRWMKKQQTLKPLERVLLKFFGKVSHVPKGDYSIHFQQLHNTLFDEVNPLVNANVLDYLDFRQWIGRYLKRIVTT